MCVSKSYKQNKIKDVYTPVFEVRVVFMEAILARSIVPVCAVLASEDCLDLYEHELIKSGRNVLASPNCPVRFVPLPDILAPANAPPVTPSNDKTIETIFNLHEKYGKEYFPELVHELVLQTTGLDSHQRQNETFGHPVACIIAVSDKHPSPIGALTQLYQQSFKGFPKYLNCEFIRCAVYVRTSEPKENAEEFSIISNEFGPHCYEMKESDFENVATELAQKSVYAYLDRLVRQWQNVNTKTSGSLGFGKFLKKFVSSGPPRPETNIFREVSREMQPHVASIPAPRRDSLLDLDLQMRRLADVGMFLHEYTLSRSAYESLRKSFTADQKWGALGACCEMIALSASLSLNSSKGLKDNTGATFISDALDSALYTYYSRIKMPVYSLRCVLIVCACLCDKGYQLLAVGTLATTLVELSPEPLMGDNPAEMAVLMDRVAKAFEGHGWHRKALLWNTLSEREWQRALKERNETNIEG